MFGYTVGEALDPVLRASPSTGASPPGRAPHPSRGNGLAAWEEVLRAGYEGMVGKDPESPYRPGRTLSWLKVKQKAYRKLERGFYK